jgi:type IV pilus assembly protein PilB
MAQRMVRKICEHCKQEIEVNPQILEMLQLTQEEGVGLKIYEGKGCNNCNNIGYSGRTGLFEVMPITPAIERMIVEGRSSADIKEKGIEQGMLTLRSAGLEKLKLGITSVEEVVAETAA